ncbi:MAG TPA: hypothetical protein VFS32_14895, partial [Candidatus Limnocylindrales bacterium]|nr:hypothetical protein [Candidatus Limnocylindrales bacterium]
MIDEGVRTTVAGSGVDGSGDPAAAFAMRFDAWSDGVPAGPSRPFVFLDKDGTLIEDLPYNVDPRRVRFVAGADA